MKKLKIMLMIYPQKWVLGKKAVLVQILKLMNTSKILANTFVIWRLKVVDSTLLLRDLVL